MTKILFIADNFLPHVGGSRIMFYNICRRLPAGEVFVLTKFLRGSGGFDRRQKFKIFRVFLFKLPLEIFGFLSETPLYISLFVSAIFAVLVNKSKIIFAGEALPCGLIAFLFKKFFGIPYVVFTFAEDVTIVSKLNRERIIQWMVLREADVIIATCSFVRNLLEEIGVKPNKIKMVLPGVEDRFFRQDNNGISALRRELGITDRRVVLTVARLIKRKGHHKVIEALPEIIKLVPNVVYLIIGKGEEEEDLKKLVREKNLGDYVKFIGGIPYYEDRLLSYYSMCDLFIMPNRTLSDGDIEGFGLVFIEAGAFGKPVIGGNTGGTSDSIIDGVTGLRINSEDVNGIASAVIRILTDTDYARRLGEAGRRRAESEFRWQDRADTIYQISQRIAKGLSE